MPQSNTLSPLSFHQLNLKESFTILIKRIIIVLAKWCPHCIPLSLQNTKRMAKEFGVPLRILDKDVPSQLRVADTLVEKHGDWSEDYIIPQVFIEYVDGRVCHILTGSTEGISATEALWEKFLASSHYKALIREHSVSTHKQTKTSSKKIEKKVSTHMY